jgi:hypothetical protein
MTQSALRMTSRLCSMMMTVLPRSTRRKDLEELADVVEVEAGGGLVEEIEGAAGLALGELASELHALSFAAGEGGGGLAEVDVAEADVDEGFELLAGGGCHRGRGGRLRW